METFTGIIDTLLKSKEIELHYIAENEVIEQTKECTKIVNCKNEENIKVKKVENEDKEINTVFSQDKYIEYSNNFTELCFKGTDKKYIFYLLELDGHLRLDKLSVYRLHYAKKK